MKMKLKPSGAGIKGLFVNHVEKLVLGVAAAVLLWFVYGLTGLKSLAANQQPEQLKTNAQQKATEIDSSEPDADVAPTFQPVSPRAKPVAVNLADYRSTTAWDLPLKEAYAKRTLPPLLPVESLLVSAGAGSFATTDKKPESKRSNTAARDEESTAHAASGRSNRRTSTTTVGEVGYVPRLNSDELKARGYVIIVGKAPYKKQIDAFDNVLRMAEGSSPDRDKPNWLGVEVERASLESPGATVDPATLKWKSVNMRELQQFMDTWPKTMEEVVAEEYVDARSGSDASVEQIAAPLAPLVGENWGRRAAHPDFPLSRRLTELMEAEADAADEARPPIRGEADESTANDDGAADSEVKDNDGSTDSPIPMADGADEESSPRRAARKALPSGKRDREGRSADPNLTPDYRLFRFIDYSATPGQTYVYRVRLKLANPNYNVAARYLDKPEMAKQKVVFTEWSESTPAISVPKPAGVLAGTIKEVTDSRSRRGKAEPHLMLYTLDAKTGRQVGGELPLERGLLANGKLTGSWVDPSDNTMYELSEKAEFKTDALVLDFQGGRNRGRVSDKVYEPLAVLVRNADGQMAVRLEADDVESVNRFTLPPEPEESTRTESGRGSTSGQRTPGRERDRPREREREIEPRRPTTRGK